jgi:4-oxalocrotonate tautomerase
MPHVQITLLEGRSTEQKRRIARRITEVLVEEGNARAEAVSIAIVDVASDSYASNGMLVCDKRAKPETK